MTTRRKHKAFLPLAVLGVAVVAFVVAGAIYVVFFRHKITLQKPAPLEDFSDEPNAGSSSHQPPLGVTPEPADTQQTPAQNTVETSRPPAGNPNIAPAPFVTGKPGLLFQAAEGLDLSVRLDFFWPNDGHETDAKYFASGSERDKRFPWTEILLVDPRPGATNGANSKIQIRAKVRGLKALIEKGDARADLFPVRIYRTFLNDLGDGEEVYSNALTKLYGAAPKDETGKVQEPAGRQIVLKRIKELDGEDAVFISSVIDIYEDKDLNPLKSPRPPPPAFAALDGDAYYTQMHEQMGDEEPDAWAFGEALKALGFVSAGVAHPNSKRFSPEVQGADPYQFSISAKELLNVTTTQMWEDLKDRPAIESARKLLEPSFIESQRAHLKNLGGSKITGRPVTNGAFLVSTGVQKLVVTAMGAHKPGETAWRFPGVVHVTDGWMDQCLIRAPAQIFLFSGHGWSVNTGGHAFAVVNFYSRDNLTAFHDENFCLYATPYLAGNRWVGGLAALPENKVILSEKWKRDELRMQWLFMVGCDVLQANGDPFRKWESNCGTFGTLALKQLGLKGVLGFSEHGFTSASLIKRYVERAATAGITTEWTDVFRDTEARGYTWYETNETYGRSRQYSYQDMKEKVPAYLVRRGNLGEKLVPQSLQLPLGQNTVEFYELKDGAEKKEGQMSE